MENNFEDVDEDGAIAGYEPEFVNAEGIRTRYYDVGSHDDVLVLVHGGDWSGISSANVWSNTFEYLSNRFRVIAFDRIGCGMTGNPKNVEDYRYQAEIDHALDFLDEIGVESCHIAGSSRGGGLSTRLAVEEPDRFESLIIMNSQTLGPPTGDRDHRRDRLGLSFEKLKKKYESTDPEYTRFFLTQFDHQLDHITDEYCRTAAYMESRPKAQKTAEILREGNRQEFWNNTMREEMNKAHQRIRDGVLTQPTLYIYGRNDINVPLDMVMSTFNEISQTNSKVRLKMFNDCGHHIFREYPEEFSQTTIDFINYWDG
jgi:pimeloyl-ACP methyl ester carboxylesterase